MTLHTPLPAPAVARVLASVVRRVMAGSASGPAFAVLFGAASSVAIGNACLCTLHDVPGGVSIDWAPDSGEAQSFLLPLLDAALGA